jgi:hypothetical protein
MAIAELATQGLLAIVAAGIFGIVAQVLLSFLSQRSQNQILSQGMQAVVGTNTIETVDSEMDDQNGGN